jgi:hypothetical protein
MPSGLDEPPYKVEPAKTGRSTCKASKEIIAKGELRFGSLVDIGGHGSYHWRKLAYITGKQVNNLITKMGGINWIAGWSDLSAKQQNQLVKACHKAMSIGAKMELAKAKAASLKVKVKSLKVKAKEAKAKAKAKAAAAKEAKKAKAGVTRKPAAALADEPPAKRARGAAPAADPDPKVLRTAHKAIDLAKNSKWKDLFVLLDAHPEVVNVRPVEREYGILHQAAFNGSQLAVDQLIDKYGADKSLRTKSKETVAGIAKGQGYGILAWHIAGK